MAEDDVHAALLQRAQSTNRALTLLVVGAAFVVSLTAVYLAVGDAGRGGIWYGKAVGITGGLTFAATFVSTMTVGFLLSRRYLVRRLRTWTQEAVRAHGLEKGSLDYIVTMYAKGLRRDDPSEP